MKPIEKMKSARKKWSAVRGPIMLVVVTLFLGIVGLRITETFGVKDATEWMADYTGLFFGLLFVIGLGALGAFFLIMIKKFFRGRREPHAWENQPDEENK